MTFTIGVFEFHDDRGAHYQAYDALWYDITLACAHEVDAPTVAAAKRRAIRDHKQLCQPREVVALKPEPKAGPRANLNTPWEEPR